MASDKEYLDFVLEQLSGADGITYRAMMGEYIIYCRGKVIGGIYDDRFLVKPTDCPTRAQSRCCWSEIWTAESFCASLSAP